ncbi:pectinesterase QRT1-like protein [Carex littledalei]|uniref:Pectinesterase n=1 Tax=Carex littledalei TaxID=544730 RepID=A0A833QQA4_9POAL|nr:pectinesterase QRT1-like protein [Carex littledalei]
MASVLPTLLMLLSVFAMTMSTSLSLGNRYSNFITWEDLSIEKYSPIGVSKDQAGGRIIVVSKDDHGDSRTVQGAINMVPNGNSERVKILIYPGVYRQVTIPVTKPYISLIGTGKGETKITWHSKASDRDSAGHTVGTFYSASFAVEADYFGAKEITFENSAPAAMPGAVGEQAVALRLSGDKAMLSMCKILGTQDTLFDQQGRHYFYRCFIQGSIDFIFGNARSLYQGCTLHAVATSYGAVAASQRNSPAEDSGFSFLHCRLTGSGMLYLGRAWGRYARVVYAYSRIDGIVLPDGWSDWGDSSRRRTAYFGEYKCHGAGANLRNRANWARSLSYQEARPFLGRNYIDGNQWLRL